MERRQEEIVVKYGQIAGNSSINAMIYHCFGYICEDDERGFVKKFREQPSDSDQIMHTFGELILGAYLGSRGFSVKYDRVVDSKTPDWIILDAEAETIKVIIELVNFHIDKATEKSIEQQIRATGMAVCWRDSNKDNLKRLYHSLWEKASKYKALVGKLEVPYIVAVFPEFTAPVEFEEVGFCLLDEESGLFGMYPGVSGVLYFEESSGQYVFSYLRNPYASRRVDLPAGVFSGQWP